MKDRVPTYPGRVILTPVSGETNTYDLVRADEPQQAGDPLNKNTLLKDETAAKFGLGPDAVPDDVFRAIPNEIASVGDIKASARTNLGDKWLLCNGDVINMDTHKEIYDEIGVELGDAVTSMQPAEEQNNYAFYGHSCIAPDGTVFVFERPTGGSTAWTVKHSKNHVDVKTFALDLVSAGWKSGENDTYALSFAVTEDRIYVATTHRTSDSTLTSNKNRPVISYIGWDGEKTVGSWTHTAIGLDIAQFTDYYGMFAQLYYNGNGAFFLGMRTSGGNGYVYRFTADLSSCVQSTMGTADSPQSFMLIGEHHVVHVYQEEGYYGTHYNVMAYNPSTGRIDACGNIVPDGNSWGGMTGLALKDGVLYGSYGVTSGDPSTYYFGKFVRNSGWMNICSSGDYNVTCVPSNIFSYNNELYCGNTMGGSYSASGVYKIDLSSGKPTCTTVRSGSVAAYSGDITDVNGSLLTYKGGRFAYVGMAVPHLPTVAASGKVYTYIKVKE